MKKVLLSLTCFATSFFAVAQEKGGIGIGRPLPDQSAELHVDSQNKGILIPQVKLTGEHDITTIKGGKEAPESLLVYNTSSGQGVTPGYYYWKKDNSDESNSKWIRILTDSDKTTLPKFVNQIDSDGKLTDNFLYSPDAVNPTIDTLSIPIPELVKKHQTVTFLKLGVKDVYYCIGDEILFKEVGASLTEEESAKVLSVEMKEPVIYYENEKGETQNIIIKDLLGASEVAITALEYDSGMKSLVFINEKGEKTNTDMEHVVRSLQTTTKLEFNEGTSMLKYLDEKGIVNAFSIAGIVKTPWLAKDPIKGSTQQANNLSNEFFTEADWVGIGYTEKSTIAGEALRIRGAITATNSYYADYVFEDYFEGESFIKPDYSFKSIDIVESFITSNRHLPGITPISELEVSEKGYSFNVSELSIQLLEKTEELFLYTIDLNKKLKEQEKHIKSLEAMIDLSLSNFEILNKEILKLKNEQK